MPFGIVDCDAEKNPLPQRCAQPSLTRNTTDTFLNLLYHSILLGVFTNGDAYKNDQKCSFNSIHTFLNAHQSINHQIALIDWRTATDGDTLCQHLVLHISHNRQHLLCRFFHNLTHNLHIFMCAQFRLNFHAAAIDPHRDWCYSHISSTHFPVQHTLQPLNSLIVRCIL